MADERGTRGRWKALGLSGGGGTETPAISPHDPGLILINCDMSGAYRTEDGGRSWSLIHWRELTGCPFCAPAFHPSDPDTVFAAYSYAAQLRVSRDRGRTWRPAGRGLPDGLRLIAIDPDRPLRMLAGTGRALFRSEDGGLTWSPCLGFAGETLGVVFDRTAPDDRPLWFAASADRVWQSPDAGLTWQPVGGLPPMAIAAFAGGSNAREGSCELYAWLEAAAPAGAAATLGQVWASGDRGAAWRKVADMPVPAGHEGSLHRLLVTDVRPRTLYAVKPVYSAADTVHRSDDGGVTWRPVAFADKTAPAFNLPVNYVTAYFLPRSLWGWNTCGAAINPADPEHVLFNHYCSVFITRDGGRTWASGETRPADGPPAPSEPLARLRWRNNGLVNTTTWNYYVAPFDHRRHFIAYTDLGMARSDDAGASWTWMRETGPNTYEMAFDPDVPGRVWAALSAVHDIPNNNIVLSKHPDRGKGSVGCSTDGGLTWRGSVRGLPGGDEAALYDWSMPGVAGCPVTSVILDPRSPPSARVLYASCWGHGVYRSDDGGGSWAPRSSGLGAPGVNLRVCRLQIHADGSLFAAVTGLMGPEGLRREGVGLYRSADAGVTWRDLTAGLDIRWVTDYGIDPQDSRVLYLSVCDDPHRTLREGGLYGSRDGGLSWTRLVRKSSLHFGAVPHPRKADWVYMTLTYNDGACPPLWLSRDRGVTWTPFEDYPFCSAHRVTHDPDDESRIYVTGYGGSVWAGPAEP